MGLTREERETVILFSQADGVATVTTSDPVVRRRMTRLFGKPAEEWDLTKRWVVPVANVLPRRIGSKKGVFAGKPASRSDSDG